MDIKKASVRPVRLHDLRHAFATTMLSDGVPLKTVPEMLGHSGIAITADTDGQIGGAAKRDAAHRIGQILQTAGVR